MNQTDGVPVVLLVVVCGVHTGVRDAHIARITRAIVRTTCPVADVLIDSSNRSGITPASSRQENTTGSLHLSPISSSVFIAIPTGRTCRVNASGFCHASGMRIDVREDNDSVRCTEEIGLGIAGICSSIDR